MRLAICDAVCEESPIVSRTSHARASASATFGSIDTCWLALLDVGELVQPGVCDCDEECGSVAPVLPLEGAVRNGGCFTSVSAMRFARASLRVGPPV